MRQLSSLHEEQIQQLIDYMKEEAGELTSHDFTANKVSQAKKKLFSQPDGSEVEKPTDTALPNKTCEHANGEEAEEEHSESLPDNIENLSKLQRRVKHFNSFYESFEKFDGEVSFVSHLATCIHETLNSSQRKHLLFRLKKKVK
tara:strand:- start:91 stop:522 length:432 start_codon:yes stop_codon:yes gene_type:complete